MTSSSGQTPPHVSTDTVIPLHSRDDTEANKNVSVEFTMQFDDVLDAETLAWALWKLLEKPGWRKLGARLRMNENGKLEYHIPAQYTQERPPFNFTQVHHEGMRFLEHPKGAKFPAAKEGDEIQSFDDVEPLRDLTQTEDSTKVLADWIYTDKAQLGLHIVTFSDATLVTLNWLHTLLDGMGRKELLSAWTAVLEGRDDEVPEFWGYDFDPLASLGGEANEKKVKSKAPEEEKSTSPTPPSIRTLCIPAAYMARLRKEATTDLESLHTSDLTINTSNNKPFLSDGDILTACLTRLMATSSPRLLSSAHRPVAVVNILGMRDLLSTSTDKHEALLPKGKAYVGNCATGISSLFEMQKFVTMPLGHIAAKLRKDLVVQGTREAVEASLRRSQPQAQMQGNEDMAPAVFAVSNWSKGRFFDTDFSAAIVGEGGSGTGKPSFIYVHGHMQAPSFAGVSGITGKDGKGNYWASFSVQGGSEARDA
jgi:hypothetical protein